MTSSTASTEPQTHTSIALPVPWLWPGKITLGSLTLIAGDPGVGKSLLTLDLAARVSTGRPFPGEDPEHMRIRTGVVVISGEDSVYSTILPRLTSMGADLRRIAFLTPAQFFAPGQQPTLVRPLRLDRGLSLLHDAMDSVEDCRLVIIDPITTFIGADASRAQAVRTVLTSVMGQLLCRRNLTVVMVAHLNKTRRRTALSGVGGCISFTAMARSAWLVTRDPKEREDGGAGGTGGTGGAGGRRLMLPIKNNLGDDESGLAFFVREDEKGRARVEWEAAGPGGPGNLGGPGTPGVKIRADDAMREESEAEQLARSSKREAMVWLAELLADGPRAAREVYALALKEGISKRTLERAKLGLGVVAKRAGFRGPWSWYPEEGRGKSE